MSRVLAYDPRDLTLGVEPGIAYRALSETLAAEKQFLPLAPPFADRATIGGIIAADSQARCARHMADRAILFWGWNSSPAKGFHQRAAAAS